MAALAPDSPDEVAVVSRGVASATAGRLESLAGDSGRIAVVIVGGAGLLIVGALQLTMLQRRRGEMAVRQALGATPRDLAAAHGAEAVILGAVGGFAGVTLAGACAGAARCIGLGDVPPPGPLGTLLGAAAGALVTLVAALAPTLAAVRRDPADVLRSLGDSLTT